MKNLKKFLPLFALVLGLGLIVTQSAFKTPKNMPNYGQDANGFWHSLDGLVEINPEETPQTGEYICLDSERVCKAYFSYPNPSQNATDYDISSVELGTFIEGTN